MVVFLWWNIFQLFCFKYFKRRDGPPLPENSSPFTFSTLQFIDAVKQAKKFPNMFRYLIAWFCFSDGLNTLSTAAVIFATTELSMTSTEAALLILEALLLGSFGGIIFLYIQRKIGWDAKRMLLLHILTFTCLVLFSMLGFVPDIPFGLVHKFELYIFVFIYGLNWGSIQSYARSVFAYLVPVGKESQMFALYEITDKGSSWIGPLMVALITNVATIRWGMFYVTSFFVIAMPLLIWGVDLVKGMQQAGRWKTIDHDDPNLAGLGVESSENDDDKMKCGELGYTKNIEMTETNGNADNYHDPRVKITVTSIDDEENEQREQEKIEPNSRTELVEKEDEDHMNGNNGHNHVDDNDEIIKTKPKIDSVPSATDDEDEDENNDDIQV